MPQLGHTLYVVSATHWDREWRFPFQETRMMLWAMMDRLLDLLEACPDYACYHLDGQTIPLEDYLEVEPGARDRIRRQVAAGRLLIGPWYTLPCENMVSPESLVRNLLWGDRLARQFGAPMRVGYMPCSYGQVSQMPQILAGFGLDSAMFYRGINRDVCPRTEYLWEGADGTRVLAFRLGDYARSNYFHLVFRPAAFNRDRSQQTHHWEDGGRVFRLCDGSSITPYHVLESAAGFFPENVGPAMENLERTDIVGTNTDLALGFQCQDSLEPAAVEVDIIKKAQSIFGADKVVHTSLPAYVEAVRRRLSETGVQLQVVTGEMRHTLKEGVWTDLYPHIQAARTDLKIANRDAELALQRWAEPWSAVGLLLGVAYPEPFLRLAWRFLLSTHAHDSISGCSMDRVHREGMHRFEQTRILSEGITRRMLEAVAQHIALPGQAGHRMPGEPSPSLPLPPGEGWGESGDKRPMVSSDFPARAMYLVVFNPSSHQRSEAVFAEVDLPEDWGDVEPRLTDLAGRPIPAQVALARPTWAIFQRPTELPLRLRVRRYPTWFLAEDVPALGYRVFGVQAVGAGKSGDSMPSVSPEAVHPSAAWITGKREMENDALRVAFRSDGTFDLSVKGTNLAFERLGAFEDDGEVGDPWVRVEPAANDLLSTVSDRAQIAVVERGPVRATFRVEREFTVPARSDRYGRSQTGLPVSLCMDVTLAAGARRVDVVTRVVNRARDHRLRTIFPTHIPAQVSAAESTFDVVERPIAVPDGAGWKEPPSGCQPMFRFVDVSDGQRGLALVSHGLIQYEVLDRADRAIALTLLRSFQQRNSVRVAEYPDQVDSQCLGEHTFRYALYPHAGRWEAGDVVPEADHHSLPLLAAQMGPGEARCAEMFGAEKSFLAVEPRTLQFGAFKKSEEGEALIVRLANPTGTAADARVTLARPPAAAELVNLNEDRVVGPVEVEGRTMKFRIVPKGIATLKVYLK